MERKYFRNLTEEEKRRLKENIFQNLQLPDREEKRSVRPVRKLVSLAGIAAALFVAAGLLIFQESGQSSFKKITLASTGIGEVRHFTLPDGSAVVLSPGSKLFGKAGKRNSREVFLEGTGFFKVKHASSQKFIVHANAVEVTVLGTEFNVDARSPEIEVALTSGKVSVRNLNSGEPQSLRPGEMITFSSSGKSFSRSLIDTSTFSAWTRNVWTFKNAKLAEIAELIKKYYAIDVVFQNKQKEDLQMTAVIPVTTIEELMEVIGGTLQVDLKLDNQKLLIQ